ncbi:hypothetical protein HPG69_015014, partial [Diceros bicornis minor]
ISFTTDCVSKCLYSILIKDKANILRSVSNLQDPCLLQMNNSISGWPLTLVVLCLGFHDSIIIDRFVHDSSLILHSSISDTWLAGPMVIVSAVLTLFVILLFSVNIIKTIKKSPLFNKEKRPFLPILFKRLWSPM